MKKLLYILVLSMPLLSGCHQAIWDKLKDHEARIARLEAFCNQLNTNITSLQSVVDVIGRRDYVKDVVPVMENGKEIGYTITFGSSRSITVYNGKNGEDAPVPQIGIRQDTDNHWYWTLNGDWLLGPDGNKARADSLTPQLKIDQDCWWVSYDSGASWTNLGPALEGTGTGYTMLDVQEDNKNVYLVLSNGETITIPKGSGLTFVYV